MGRGLVVGDLHLDRNLPHSQNRGETGNDRYEFRKKLFRDSIAGWDTIFLAGDVTHRKDLIEGQLMYDYEEMIEGKNIVHVLGNHDWSGKNDEKSLGQIIARKNSRYLAVEKTEIIRWGAITIVCASYYASEQEIMEAVEKAMGSGKVFVLGHWNFWNPKMGGKEIPLAWAQQVVHHGVSFALGHVHPPGPLEHNLEGAYIGVISPVRFGERQGYMLEIDEDGSITPRPYPYGEEFVEFKYEEKTTWAFKQNEIENKYIKVFYDPRRVDAEKVRIEMQQEFEGCRRLFVVPDASALVPVSEKAEEEIQRRQFRVEEEDYIREAITDHNLCDYEERLIAKHREIKRMVE